MARAPGLSAPTLSPFGGSGAGFGAFSIVDPGREAYITFLKVENSWQNAKASDADYLAAMRVYANALPEGSSTRLNTEQRILETTYRVERNVLVSQIDNNERGLLDLLQFDREHMAGLDPNSETYRDRRGAYEQTQRQVFAEGEETIVQRYQEGTLTTAQLQAWYRSQVSAYDDNAELSEAIGERIRDLDLRVLDERDSRTITDYNEGRITDDEFLVYAGAARARYATGTQQAIEWDQRIGKAQDSRAENGLLYRYGLSQKYAELQRFIKSNSASSSRTSTSTSKRIVLGADGKWHTITTTSTKAVAPSRAEVEAHQRLQIELADAKKQMAEIVGKLGSVPGGGSWVTTDSMIVYYRGQQSELARGSADWYALQEKIDSLQERKHSETVLSQQGIRITYPGASSPGSSGSGGSVSARTSPTGSATSGPTTRTGTVSRSGSGSTEDDVSIDEFMAALAKVESGGRYDARNKTSGAFGKYQIMPANWPSWAQKYLGDAGAPQSPENQEKVARGRIADFYRQFGSWDAVAYAWLNGPGKYNATHPETWSSSGSRYVANVMGNLGRSPAKPAAGATTTPRTTGAAPTNRGALGGLTELTAINTPLRRSGQESLSTRATSFPVNLDGRAFEKFYAAYERAFNAGAESFVDNSSGKAVAYFIGDDPLERIDRMRQLDDLRVTYYAERAQAYEGTATEIVARNQYDAAIRDVAAHEYRILDTANERGSQYGGNVQTNPLAGGVRLLDKTIGAIQASIAAAQAAYDRGDIATAYAHYQIAAGYLETDQSSTGTPLGTTVRLSKLLAATEAKIAAIGTATGGITPEEALGQSAGGAFGKDLERLRSAQVELATALSAGDKLLDTIKTQVKVNDRTGDPVLDPRTGQAQLAEGWARIVDINGKVTFEPMTQRVNEKSGGIEWAADDDYVKVLTRSGSTTVDAYAKWEVDTVGWIRGENENFPLQGKKVTIMVNGKPTTMFEDPLNPGRWSSSPIVFNRPGTFSAVPDGKGHSIYQFKLHGKGADGVTYSLQFDAATGTYLVVGNREAGLFRSAMENVPVGAAGSVNVLDLLKNVGLTRDTSGAGAGFVDVSTPVFGMTPPEYQNYLNPKPAANMLNQPIIPLNSTGGPDDRDELRAARARAFANIGNLSAARRDLASDVSEMQALKSGGLGVGLTNAKPPAPPQSQDPLARTVVNQPIANPGSPTLPAIKLPTISRNADIDAAKRIAATNRTTSTASTAPKAPAPTNSAPRRVSTRPRRTTSTSKVPLRQPTTTISQTKLTTLTKLAS